MNLDHGIYRGNHGLRVAVICLCAILGICASAAIVVLVTRPDLTAALAILAAAVSLLAFILIPNRNAERVEMREVYVLAMANMLLLLLLLITL